MARGRHSSLGEFEATIEDLSVYGMALIIQEPKSSLVLVGDRLESLQAASGSMRFYEGTAIVRRATESEGKLTIGIELEGGGLDLGELYRRGERFSFAERLYNVSTQIHLDTITPEFKTWVSDLRTYLETLKQFLDEEERALEGLDQLTREQTLEQYLVAAAPVVIERMNRAAEELGVLVDGLPAEMHAAHRNFFRKHLMEFIRCSPLLRRAYDKPLGYAGDYEVMNMLYRDHAEGASLFARCLNLYAAQEQAARANINRIAYLSNHIVRILEKRSVGRTRMASIGCGPAREVLETLRSRPDLGSRLEIALIDQEERAIKYCERTLGPLAARTGARVEFIRESVRRLLVERQLGRVLGERHFIYSAGLFDYLNTRTFSALMAALYGALEKDGLLAIGNVAEHNPSRWFMQYCLDWFLVHRSREELLEAGNRLQPPPASVEVEAEPLGLNLFVLLRR